MQPLITLDEYKTYSSISSVEFDPKLSKLITGISALVREYCSRELITDGVTPIVEYNDGGNMDINVLEFPIISITSLEISTDYGVTYTPTTDYVHHKVKDSIYLPNEDLVELPNKYRLTYIGGYLSTPEDLKLAVLDLVDYYHKNETVPKRMNNFVTIEYVKTSDFPPHIKRVLDLYRVI